MSTQDNTDNNLKEEDTKISLPEQNLKTVLNIEEMSMDTLLNEQNNFLDEMYGREIVKVKVVQISDSHIFVDVGEKKEGLIDKTEFEDKEVPPIGKEINAVLIKKGNEESHAILSHKKAAEKKGLDLCKEAKENNAKVRGIIRETVKGGYIVEVFSIKGFMPLSLSEIHPTFKHHLPKEAKIRVQIIELSTYKKNMILSRKQVLVEDEQKRREKVLENVKVGDELRVVVSKPVKNKLFLRYQGIEAVVKVENVSWRDPENAIKNFKRGQRLRAKLLVLDKEKNILEVGFKQLYPNPANILKRKYPLKSVVKGKVEKITDDGMVISVSSRTQGFVPSSEFGQELEGKEGKNISCIVTGVNMKNFMLNLSVKRFEMFQNRRIVAQYLKKPPPMTLGQLLSKAREEKEQQQ